MFHLYPSSESSEFCFQEKQFIGFSPHLFDEDVLIEGRFDLESPPCRSPQDLVFVAQFRQKASPRTCWKIASTSESIKEDSFEILLLHDLLIGAKIALDRFELPNGMCTGEGGLFGH